jgi:hypothetical protein
MRASNILASTDLGRIPRHMEQARLVSLLLRLRYANQLIRHTPLRREIAALEHTICKLNGHSFGNAMQCSVCHQNIAVVVRKRNDGVQTSNRHSGIRRVSSA